MFRSNVASGVLGTSDLTFLTGGINEVVSGKGSALMCKVVARSLPDERLCGMVGSLGSGLMLNELVGLLARKAPPEVNPKLASRRLRRLGRDVFSLLRPLDVDEDIYMVAVRQVMCMIYMALTK